MHVFYQPDLSLPLIRLSEEESKHCIRVMRLKKGDEVLLADGKGTRGIARITDDNPKRCVLELSSRSFHDKGRDYYLHLMVAPTKNSERMEWFLEKATEAGIDRVTFIGTENSERSRLNLERFEKIAISAMKQSKQWWLPEIAGISGFDEAVSGETEGLKLIAWCEAPGDARLNEVLAGGQHSRVTCLVGPEGDFTPAEARLAVSRGFQPVSLGKSILRTETAALYVCMAVKTLYR